MSTRIESIQLFYFFEHIYLHRKKYFVVCRLDASIFTTNSNIETAEVQ